MTLFVINIGNTGYSQYSLPLIKKLCDYNGVNLFVLEENIPQNIYNLHPSWLKLFCFDIIDDDFIVSWDLDLVPKKNYELKSFFNTEMLNMAYDTSYIVDNFTFNGKFKYNCGLIGASRKYSDSLKSIYYNFGKFAMYPSYEQYYVNDWIFDNNIPVNLIDSKLNTHFDGNDDLNNENFNTHYTWKIKNNQHRIDLIKKHFDIYEKDF